MAKYKNFSDCCCDVEVLKHGIIMDVKEKVTMKDLMKFNGFVGDERMFKYTGDFDKYGEHSMRIYDKEGKSFSYTWGASTSIISGEDWTRNWAIVRAMEELTGLKIYRGY